MTPALQNILDRAKALKDIRLRATSFKFDIQSGLLGSYESSPEVDFLVGDPTATPKTDKCFIALAAKETAALVTALELVAKQNEMLREAHERTEKVIGAFIDRITPEATINPDLSTAHLGMIESLHCYNRSTKALAECAKLDEQIAELK